MSSIASIAPSLGQLPTSSKKDKASQLADLENEIQQTDQLIKETKTVSVNDIMADQRDTSKAKAKELLKSSVKQALNIEDIQQKEENMKVTKSKKKSLKAQPKAASFSKKAANVKSTNHTKPVKAKVQVKITASKNQSLSQVSKK